VFQDNHYFYRLLCPLLSEIILLWVGEGVVEKHDINNNNSLDRKSLLIDNPTPFGEF